MDKIAQNKLIPIREWLDQRFKDSYGPSPVTVRRWCRQGYLQSERVGGRWFIQAGATYNNLPESQSKEVEAMIARISAKL